MRNRTVLISLPPHEQGRKTAFFNLLSCHCYSPFLPWAWATLISLFNSHTFLTLYSHVHEYIAFQDTDTVCAIGQCVHKSDHLFISLTLLSRTQIHCFPGHRHRMRHRTVRAQIWPVQAAAARGVDLNRCMICCVIPTSAHWVML